MERYKSIYTEASKAKIKDVVKSTKSLCYVVNNFTLIVPNSELKKVLDNNLEQFIYETNGLACDIYFTENKSNTVTINILSGDKEFIKVIQNVDSWMKYKGDVWSGEGPEAQLIPKYSFDETKALKWFKDNFYNKGRIYLLNDILGPFKIGTHPYTINNVLTSPIHSVTPDVEVAKSYLVSNNKSKKPSSAKSKKRR